MEESETTGDVAYEKRLTRLEVGMTQVVSSLDRMATENANLANSINKIGRPNWQVIVALGAVVVSALGLFGAWISGQVDAKLSPINSSVATLQQQAASSATDRNDMNRGQQMNITSIAALTAALQSEVATRLSTMKEVETQFDALAQEGNTQFAAQQRKNSELQNALHEMGAKMPPYPTGPFFFPNISNRAAERNNQ